jgi:hypothetical protein
MVDANPFESIVGRAADDWFAATARGCLLVQRCSLCETAQFYPRRHCAHCGAPGIEWVTAAGTGRLHTFSIVHRTPNAEFAALTPYVFAIVELTEGPRMTTSVIDVPHDELYCDMPVRVVFRQLDEAGLVRPFFTRGGTP